MQTGVHLEESGRSGLWTLNLHFRRAVGRTGEKIYERCFQIAEGLTRRD